METEVENIYNRIDLLCGYAGKNRNRAKEHTMIAQNLQSWKERRFPLIAGTLHWLLTFGLERLILVVSPAEHFLDYCLCKVILWVALYGFWHLIWKAFFAPNCKKSRERHIVLFALPMLAVLVIWLFLRHSFTPPGDEFNLFTRATQLDSFAFWFNYPSGYYWIMGIMLVPVPMGPIYIKLVLQALICGYCLTRQYERSGLVRSLPLYLLFLLPFVLEQGISAHRLPIYGMLYLFLAAKLMYDRLDGCHLDWKTLVLESVILAVLAIWRTEGIYFSVLGIILIVVAYRVPLKKASLKKLLCYVLIFAAVALPQLSAYTDIPYPASLRTKPLCGYALVNMFRNGLTEEMIDREDWEAINTYLPFETIHEYNEKHGDYNYSWAFIMNDTEPDVSYDDQEKFCDATKNVILHNLPIYLKSQFNAWMYTSDQYTVDSSLNPLILLLNLSSRVLYPAILALLFCIYALLRKRWLTFWLAGGALCNWAMVTALMPAAYAKYFYVTYLLGYFLLFMGICQLISGKKKAFYG